MDPVLSTGRRPLRSKEARLHSEAALYGCYFGNLFRTSKWPYIYLSGDMSAYLKHTIQGGFATCRCAK